MNLKKSIRVLDYRFRSYAKEDLLRWHVIGLQFVIAAFFTTGFMQAWSAAIHIPLALLYGYFTGKSDAFKEVNRLLKHQKYLQKIDKCKHL